jgi:predicted transcriptional regulator
MKHFERRLAFVDSFFMKISGATDDSALSFRLIRDHENLLGLPSEQLNQWPPARDRVSDQVYQRDTGSGRGFNFSGLLLQGTPARLGNKKRGSIRLIPSETEIRILKTLWVEKKATGSAIYAQLDSVRITAAGLDEVLSSMTDRGLLTRQIISPRNEFTIAMPFVAVPLEMSAKNRRNREYLYQPAVSSDLVRNFVDAQLFNLQNSTSDERLTRYLHRLLSLLVSPMN